MLTPYKPEKTTGFASPALGYEEESIDWTLVPYSPCPLFPLSLYLSYTSIDGHKQH